MGIHPKRRNRVDSKRQESSQSKSKWQTKLPDVLGSFRDSLHGQGFAAKKDAWLPLPSPHSEPWLPCRCSAGCCFPLLILVLFYIIGARLFTRINLGGLYLRLILETDLRQPNALGFSDLLSSQESRAKRVCRNPLYLQLGICEETKGPGGAYDQVLGRNQPCLTGKGM